MNLKVYNMRTIGETISTIREQIKAVKQESFITDRYLYSLYARHAKMFMRRQDSQNKIMKFNPIFQTLPAVELIDVDRVDAGCLSLSSDTTIKRTKLKLPRFIEGYWGPLIRSVTSVDGSEEMMPTYPTTYLNTSKQKNFKYNKTKYYWFIDNYLYFPNIDWDAVKVEGVFEDDISEFNCNCDDSCIPRQDLMLSVPDFLDADISQEIMKDLNIMMRVPTDNKDDNQSITT